jgi:hypothetical protein
MDEQASYANIRELLAGFIGQRLVEITQHDEDEYRRTSEAFVMLHFADGSLIRFVIRDNGSDFECFAPGAYDNNSDES